MVRDVQSLTIRRDLVEEKEAQLKALLKAAIEGSYPNEKLCF